VGVPRGRTGRLGALVRRELTSRDVSSRVQLNKAPAEYLETRDQRRDASYEAMLASGVTRWSVGERVRVYRTTSGLGLVVEPDDEDAAGADRRDYDVDHYLHVLRETFASRLARALDPADYAAVFADPDQMSLFGDSVATARTILTPAEELPSEPEA